MIYNTTQLDQILLEEIDIVKQAIEKRKKVYEEALRRIENKEFKSISGIMPPVSIHSKKHNLIIHF